MGSFPIAKLLIMLVRQISKPISKVIRRRAKRSPIVKKYIALPPAHFYLWVEKQVNIKLYGQAPEQSPVYVEQKAVNLGANLLGEAFLFGVAVLFLTLEYYRMKRRRMAREFETGLAHVQLRQQIQYQTILAEQQEAEIRELRRNIRTLKAIADEKEEKEAM